MSSKGRSYDSGTLENQFILRLPQKQADVLKHSLNAGTLKDKLSIELQGDNRHATVRVNGKALSSKLVDLPCLIESHKTLDCKSFYKTADVCQMLICTDADEDSQGEDDSKHPHKKESKKFIWNHGITPPLKNVKKRRFRKMAKKKVSESPETEKEVKRILRTDLSAATVTFEVINDEEKPDESRNIRLPSDADLSGINSPVSRNMSQMTNNSDDEERNELLKLLQEASSDEDNDDDADRSQENDYDDVDDDDVDIEGDETEDFDTGLKSQLEDAREKLDEIRSSKAQQIARVNGADNPFLKERFQKILEGILKQEKEQEQELEKIEKELAENN